MGVNVFNLVAELVLSSCMVDFVGLNPMKGTL